MDNEMGDLEFIPPDVKFPGESTVKCSVPEKSKQRYESTYEGFLKWKKKNYKDSAITREIILAYFEELASKNAPSSLWATYSMLRTMIQVNHNFDVGQYKNVTWFLKELSRGYKPKQAKVFDSEDIARFLSEAPDSYYLATKVVAIFGLAGGCKTSELLNVSIQDVERHGNLYLVKIRTIPHGISRTFTISNEYLPTVQSYINLRPKNVKTNRFFLNYQNQKCTIQPIGKNKIGKMAEEIATYLQLEEPSQYTGHSFRRTTCTALKNSRTKYKNLGTWLPASAPESERYLEDVDQNNSKTEPVNTRSLLKKSITHLSVNLQELNNNAERDQDSPHQDIIEMDSTDDMNHSNEVDYSDDTTYSNDRLDFEFNNELNNADCAMNEQIVENNSSLQPCKSTDLFNLKNITFNNCSHINIYPSDKRNSTSHTNNSNEVDFSDDTIYSEEMLNFRGESNKINNIKREKSDVRVNVAQGSVGQISSSNIDLSNSRNIVFNNCSYINIYVNK